MYRKIQNRAKQSRCGEERKTDSNKVGCGFMTFESHRERAGAIFEGLWIAELYLFDKTPF